MTHLITADTPIFQLSVSQFMDLLNRKDTCPPEAVQKKENRYVYGLSGLQDLLNCSRATALKIKQSGKIPFTQIGRKLIFEADAVLAALNRKK